MPAVHLALCKVSLARRTTDCSASCVCHPCLPSWNTTGGRRAFRQVAGSTREPEASSPLQYELQVTKNAQESTVDRWKDMYEQQAKDAMAVGLPESAVPSLPQRPTQADIKQAADNLRGIMQSFESAAL